jgi:hypothetical protein
MKRGGRFALNSLIRAVLDNATELRVTHDEADENELK